MSELAHMRRLYNDIIYFVQNHVRPVGLSSTSAYNSGINGSFYEFRRGGAGLNSVGSATSSSSLTIAEDPSTRLDGKDSESSGSPTKLFGVSICAKRREFPGEPAS
ncbi:heat stress transcription factor B-4c-like, partial [Phalaenopsis equestris]|uniref:heat stress transcription factor B-4c-like n=1 Tax=Phalaenopsis equestris TaxID=78828 RepID=UPI0009E2406D